MPDTSSATIGTSDPSGWWPVLLDGFLGALFAALLSVLVARYVLVRTLAAERALNEAAAEREADLRRESLREERLAARDAVGREAAIRLLEELYLVADGLEHVGWIIAPPAHRERAEETLAALRRGETTLALLVPEPEIRRRWADLHRLVFYWASRATGEASGLLEGTKRGRALSDIESFLAYVRRTLTAYISGDPMPPPADAPVLIRAGMEVWRAPDDDP